MPSLQQVRQSNSKLKDGPPGLVVVMAGATSGIGEATCKALVRHTRRPTVYIVGRNRARANATIAELQRSNPSATVHFIASDLTLLKNVDEVCRQIAEKEAKINLLFTSTGFLSMKGRDETSERLDKMFSLTYYSRLRFVTNLLPLLQAAAEAKELARVVSVLGAGTEGKIFTDDLALRNEANYNLRNCATQAISMTSLAFEHLAAAHPAVSFVHVSPGVVRDTGIMSGMGRFAGPIFKFLTTLAAPFNISLRESAERHLYAATSVELGRGGGDAKAFRLTWNGEPAGANAAFEKCMKDGTGKLVWDHTEQVFDEVCGKAE
ncbi:short-chain dehydrogenase reductase [Colletotrichum musicola]|uniref:Short-chain dehydrogenase reductase n=1 Tax=Colletotrichum musicola TaxID=2175873 RepID=A0A8H6KKL1_9PEZI|nr:short-chain dehydrogenase reductase [Colletotrichum musicola]